jgi:hypothetical protein
VNAAGTDTSGALGAAAEGRAVTSRGMHPSRRSGSRRLARVALALGAWAVGGDASAHPPDQGAPTAPAPWSFFGGFTSHELSNPGLHLGAEYALADTRHFRSLAAAALQAYYQPDTETGVALLARWGHRYTAGFGLTFDSALGVGVQYTRYDTTVFIFEDSMAVAEAESVSRWAFAPHVVFGLGYDFERSLAVPLHLYARPGVTLLYPDSNQAFQAFVILEVGLRWSPEL